MSFADPRASVVAYVALFAIAAVASLGLAIWVSTLIHCVSSITDFENIMLNL